MPVQSQGATTNSRSAFFIGTTDVLDREALLAQSFLGVSPWYEIRQAANGANHDWIYNHTPGPDWVKGAAADAGLYTGDLLDWNGALTLWQIAAHYAEQGRELNFKSAPAATASLINDIVNATGIDKDRVWNFYTNLDHVFRQTGGADFLRPSLSQDEKELPSFTSSLEKILLIGGAAVAGFFLLEHYGNER